MGDYKCSHRSFNCMRVCYGKSKYCYQHLDQESCNIARCSYVSKITGRKCLNPRIIRSRDRRESDKPIYCALHSDDGDSASLLKKRSHREAFGDDHSKNQNNDLINEAYISKYDSAFCNLQVKDPRNSPWDAKLSRHLPFNDIEHDHVFSDSFTGSYPKFDVCTEEELVRSTLLKTKDLMRLYNRQYRLCKSKLLLSKAKFLDLPGEHAALLSKAEKSEKDELKALFSYHTLSGEEKLMREKAKRKKAGLNGGVSNKKQIKSCTYGIGTKLCKETAIPNCNFCVGHVVTDKSQQMYSKCSGCGAIMNKLLEKAVTGWHCYCKVQPLQSESSNETLEALMNKVRSQSDMSKRKQEIEVGVNSAMEFLCDEVEKAINPVQLSSEDMEIETSVTVNSEVAADFNSSLALSENDEKFATKSPKNSAVVEEAVDEPKVENRNVLQNVVDFIEAENKAPASKLSDFLNQKTLLLSSTEPGSILVQPLQECKPGLLLPTRSETTKVCPVSLDNEPRSASSISSTKLQSSVLLVNRYSNHGDGQSKGTGIKHVVTSGTMIPPYESPPRFQDSDEEPNFKVKVNEKPIGKDLQPKTTNNKSDSLCLSSAIDPEHSEGLVSANQESKGKIVVSNETVETVLNDLVSTVCAKNTHD